MTVLQWMKRHLIVSIVIAIVLGVIVGGLIDVSWMKQLITPLTFVLVYPMMVTLRLETLIQKSNIKLQLTTQILNFIVFPLIAFGIGMLFFREEPYFRLGLLLIGLLPTSGMTISWTVMAKGNVPEAIRMIVIGLLLGALIAPFYISMLLGEAIVVPVWHIVQQILIVVFVPLILAFITQKVLMKKYGSDQFHSNIKPVFPLFSTLGVVLIIFVAIALKAGVILNNPGMILQIIPPLLLLYALYFLISALATRFFPREDGIALINGTLIRNLSIALAITLSAFEGAGIAALLIAIAYALQVQIAAWNVKLAPMLYREKEPKLAVK